MRFASRRSRRRLFVFGATALAVALVAAATFALLAPRPGPRAIAWRSLVNATYPTSLVPRGAQLRDGLYDVEAAPGSASRIVVRLADVAAFGDLDADGERDAAVVLVSSGGGSGTFVELAAVRNEGGTARPVASALLGDRILVREVRIEDGRILVRLRARGATDPLTLRTLEFSRHYVLSGDRLALRDETEAEVQAAPAESFTYRPERIDLAAGASRALTGSLQPGQLASYVIHGRAGEELALSLLSEFENAVLSVAGLTDGTTVLSRRDYVTQRAFSLPSEQDYAVKVVSLAGQLLPYTLQIQLRTTSVSPAPTVRPSSAPLPARTPSPQPTPSGPASIVERGLGQASEAATTFARSRPPIWGVAVYVPSRGVIYAENADTQVPAASVVKVLIMLAVLEQARQDHRPVSEEELALLWPMITESDNDATSQLWESIGRGQAVGSYVRAVGVTGFTPDPGTSWGVSFVSARTMATILGKLLGGDILDAPSRALAMRLLESVVREQRWGVTAGTNAASGDQVGVKDGWYPGEEGWRVNSVGTVRPRSGPDYAIAIVSGSRPSWEEGIETIEGIAGPLNTALRGAS